ncbi:hypothetical protein LCGC14_0748210 [marine sediment metagenome]|uniref:Uncharacterized protein n=1 Tax=marine sediment metagenome TaxID=412755 RepID=A0A0F9QPL4_9ZZZZ
MKSHEKRLDSNNENLQEALQRLRKYLNYKNSNFCKESLENIIHNYFKN